MAKQEKQKFKINKNKAVTPIKSKEFIEKTKFELEETQTVKTSSPQDEKEASSSDGKESQKNDIESKIDGVLSAYKNENGKSNTSSKVKYFLIGSVLVVIAGIIGYYLFVYGVPHTDEKSESSSSQRPINWDDFESDVQKKRLEADLEFEKLKENGDSNQETTDNNETNTGTDTNNTSTTVDLTGVKNDLSDISSSIGSMDDEEFTQPNLFEF